MRRSFITLLLLTALLAPGAALTRAQASGFFKRLFHRQTAPPPRRPDRTQNAYRFERNGWIFLHVEGEPHERGYQHGYLAAPELKEVQRTLRHTTPWETGMPWEFFIKKAEELYAKKVDGEFLEEIRGVADGARAAGTDITWQEVLAWNASMEMLGYWWPQQDKGKSYRESKEHCSAFVAAGTTTTLAGRIVMAHNSWMGFVDGQFYNVILDLKPARGQRLLMQAGPGLIHSATDFAVTDAGLAITETTISGFHGYDDAGTPEFQRARKAMQYAASPAEFASILMDGNNGGYANGWLLGDVKTGEIMRLELGLEHHQLDSARGGFFLGFNGPLNPQIRHFEAGSISLTDIRNSVAARRVRLTQLMAQNMGRLDVAAAERILADHYDVYLQQERPCARSVDGHLELDRLDHGGDGWGAPCFPGGAMDGKVLDSELARAMSFYARWGSSCGRPFDARAFLAEHPQFDHLAGYLKDRPAQPWTLFKADERPPGGALRTVPQPAIH